MSQTILFVCATGIATSTAVTEKVMEYCKEHGLNVNIITGIGEEKVLAQIVSILKK